MKRLTLVLLLFHSFFAGLLYSNDITFEHLGFEKGLSQITIYSLYQDEHGEIWIGTNDGLMRYSGNIVKNASSTTEELALTSGIVSTICGDKNGHIYALINERIVEFDLKLQKLRLLTLPESIRSERILAITFGKDGLWLATPNTIYKLRSGKHEKYAVIKKPNILITALCETTDGNLIVGTLEHGVYIIDNAQKQFNIISAKISVYTIYEDSKQNIWVCTREDGLFKIDNQRQISIFNNKSDESKSLSSNFVRSVCEDNKNHLWIGTSGGLDKMDLSTYDIKHYGTSTEKRYCLSSQSVRCIMKDNQGTIWTGTYSGGINYFYPNLDVSQYYDLKKSSTDFLYPLVGKIIEDKRGDFWICSDVKGLVYFNRKLKTYRYFSTNNSKISGNNIKTIYYNETDDVLWIGTYRYGFCKFDIKTGKFSPYKIGGENSTTPNELMETVHTIVPYKDYLLLGTLQGLVAFDIKNSKTTQLEITKAVRDFILDKDILWIAVPDALVKYNISTGKVEQEFKQTDASIKNLPKNRITRLYIDSKKRLWIATDGGGIVYLDRKNNSFTPFNSTTCGLENDNVSCLSESKYGYLLAGTNTGFSRIDVERKKSANYSTKNGFSLSSLNFGSIFTASDGKLVMGGIDGFTIFNEESLSSLGKPFTLRFNELWVNNKKVIPDDASRILDKALAYKDELVFKHDHRIISIVVATDNFIQANQPNLQYQLKGFNKSWVDLDQNNAINYMNLPSGNYTLTIRNLGNNEELNNNTIELKIKVLPPFYARWYAYLFYILFISGISFWIYRFSRNRFLLRASLEYERREREQSEQINQSKLRFFTNISHEFRTPLTLIIGQLEMLMQSSKIAPVFYKSIVHVHNNAQKLNQLINELLDFRKQEQGFKKLKVSEYDIVEFMHEVYLSFQEYARFKQIDFKIDFNQDRVMLWFDYSEMQKVFNNLISNAFKFTPNNGNINIIINSTNEDITISISDSGLGISKNDQEKIFNIFYQADNDEIQKKGTGIGLALSKGIVDLHDGSIWIESEPKKGSAFFVKLKFGNSHFIDNSKVEIVENTYKEVENITIDKKLDSNFITELYENQSVHFEIKPTMLIVEDNDSLRELLANIFKSLYNVLEASNGIDGYERAIEQHPDIIVSDIMMPEMSGNELCSKIKTNFETCHIPVVLLTAQTSPEQNIEGLKHGADDYITKPFNVIILLTRCNNLLVGRKLLQEKFSKQIDNTAYKIASNELDQTFIEKAIKIIEHNLSNEKLNVNLLCSEMAIGRRVFFYKMKSITGETPNDFIQNIRLKKAAWIIQNVPDKTIGEISDELGYNSISYFGKCFKAKFGIVPSEYKKIRTEKCNKEHIEINI
jgi:signal transduction histidine kinase/ligand-binding sensor domain-containing protein/DNA-binding response OmpR family regulator